ncbi:MAG: endo-1,4-beta-xylanase [Oscillospiraceae bacterium]|nr:endo-1,4-beta-xylanase [Oscillospiraceae bacterium]
MQKRTQKRKILFTFVLTAVLALSFSVSFTASAREWDLTIPSLKEVFADYFPIGNILEPAEAFEGKTAEMFTYHYNFVTAENAMKPSYIARTPHDWDFSFHRLDMYIDWALENDIQVVGHTLVWHSQSAAWLTNDEEGNPLTRAEARVNMERYINTVAGHFAGRIYSWDVVNEALRTSVGSPPITPADEGWWKNMLRTGSESSANEASAWYAAYANGMDEAAGECPSDYIYDAFVFARLADPNAILYYNDFNETGAGKREAMAQMTEEINARWETDPRNTEPGRLLLEGIGMQAHYWTSDLSPVSVELTIMRFAETGAKVSITEIDIPMGRYGAYEDATEENLTLQAKLYRDVFDVFMRHSDSIERVTFWGKADPQSWRKEGSPLLFNANFEAKEAYHSILTLVLGAVPADTQNNTETEVTEQPAVTAPQEDTQDGKESSLPVLWIIIAIAGGAVLIIGGIVLLKKR